MPPTRGDVYWAQLDPIQGSEQGGRRPVVIVSRDSINTNLPNVIVLPMSSSASRLAKPYPSQIIVHSRDLGMIGDGVILGEQIRTISQGRLERYISHLPANVMANVDEVLKIVLKMKDPTYP